MKTRNLNGLTMVGIAAFLFGAVAMVPANADVRHDNNNAKVEIKIGSNIKVDLKFGTRPDNNTWNPQWYHNQSDDRDRDWNRDRDKDRDQHEDRDRDRR